MPRRRSRQRFRPQRSRARLERFLQRCCFICMNAPNEYPSKRLPTNLHDACPRCRRFISSYNHSEDIPPGLYPFRFDFFHYPPPPPLPPSPDNYFDYFGIPQDSDFRYLSDSNRLFLNPPVPSPPAAWVAFRRSSY